jgi:hypothetical protein
MNLAIRRGTSHPSLYQAPFLRRLPLSCDSNHKSQTFLGGWLLKKTGKEIDKENIVKGVEYEGAGMSC